MPHGQKIAEIKMKPEVNEPTLRVDFTRKTLKFRCQRCAVFCCKLGGPKLTIKDIQRLTQARIGTHEFLVADGASLKNREDGSCIFLSFDNKESLYRCSVYDHRPALCRLYPFRVEKSGLHNYALELIPCCNGLNTKDGEFVNVNFFTASLKEALLELIESNAI